EHDLAGGVAEIERCRAEVRAVGQRGDASLDGPALDAHAGEDPPRAADPGEGGTGNGEPPEPRDRAVHDPEPDGLARSDLEHRILATVDEQVLALGAVPHLPRCARS